MCSTRFYNSEDQSRRYFDWWDRKNTTDEEQNWRERKWAGENAFSNLDFFFSVWCKLVTVIYEKAFSGSYCLSAASRHPSGSLTSSALVVLLVTILEQHRETKHVRNNSDNKGSKVSMLLSYPLVVPVGVIPRCVKLSGSITRVWSVGKGRAITVIATWQQEKH